MVRVLNACILLIGLLEQAGYSVWCNRVIADPCGAAFFSEMATGVT